MEWPCISKSQANVPHQNGTTTASYDRIRWILCISGKRKSGKDFVTRHLGKLIDQKLPAMDVSICILSEPLKEEFAQRNGLNAAKLMGDGEAKELVRSEMIAFGEDLRAKDRGIFCKKAMARRKSLNTRSGPQGCGEIVLVSDCRRPSDLQYFRQQFPATPLLCIRVDSPLELRKMRGFVFKEGVDDAESECALDNFAKWDFRICNDRDGIEDGLDGKLAEIFGHLQQTCEQDLLNGL